MRKLSATMTGRTFHKAIIIVKTFDRCKFQYATPQFKQTNNNLSSHSNLGLHAERTCAKPSGFGASGSYNWLPSSAADWLSGSAPRSLALPAWPGGRILGTSRGRVTNGQVWQIDFAATRRSRSVRQQRRSPQMTSMTMGACSESCDSLAVAQLFWATTQAAFEFCGV